MLNKFKPITPGLRGTVLVSKKHLSNKKPIKSLTKPMTSTGGRNNQGKLPQEEWVNKKKISNN